MVVRRLPSSDRSSPRVSSASPVPVHGRLRLGLGCVSRRRSALRLVVSRLLQLFHQPPGASCGSLRRQGFSSLSSGSGGCLVGRQHHGIGLPLETGGHPVPDSQFRGPDHSAVLRVSSHSSLTPVHPGQAECPGRFVEPQRASPQLRMDPLLRGVPPAASQVAGHHRLIHGLSEPLSPGLFFTDGRSIVSGHGCSAPVVGRAPGSRLTPFPLRSDPTGSGQDLAIAGFGAHPRGSVLDATTLVPGSPGTSGGDSILPTTNEGSSQTTAFPPLPPEPPCASADCISFMQQSARHFGFSKGVASQLANCLRRSTRVNYQAKWTVYRYWCRRHGHSVSCPSVAKVADFLLVLHRSLSLSYSSIASYAPR